MKRAAVLLLAIAMVADASHYRFYDREGHYQGEAMRQSDGTLRYYDREGHYRGEIDHDGAVYDREGHYLGRQIPAPGHGRGRANPFSNQ